MRKKYLIIFVTALLVALFPLVLPAATDNFKLNVGIMPIIDHLPVVVATEEFSAEIDNISVNMETFYSWTALEAAFRTGAIDAVAMVPTKAFLMYKDNIPAKVVAVISRNGYSLALKGEADPDSLKGKILGLSGTDTIDYLLLYKYLQDKKLRLGYDVECVLIPYKMAISAVKDEKIYGFLLSEPYGLESEKEKAASIVAISKDILPSHIGSVIMVSNSLISQHPKDLSRWLKTISRAARFIQDDKVKSMGKQTAVIAEKKLNFNQQLVMDALTKPPDRVLFTGLKPKTQEFKLLLDMSIEAGIIDESINLASLLNDTFIDD